MCVGGKLQREANRSDSLTLVGKKKGNLVYEVSDKVRKLHLTSNSSDSNAGGLSATLQETLPSRVLNC